MAPITSASNESNHDALLDKLDIHAIRKPFRNPHWRPPQRRNKSIKQILSDAARKEASASVLATQNNSGASTPAPTLPPSDSTAAAALAALLPDDPSRAANVNVPTPNLSTLLLAKTSTHSLTKRAATAAASTHLSAPPPPTLLPPLSSAAGTGSAGGAGPPAPTYTNVESAPSLRPASQRRYCDITGLPAPYTDPKTRLRYHNKEVFGVVRALKIEGVEGYLGARGVNTVLK